MKPISQPRSAISSLQNDGAARPYFQSSGESRARGRLLLLTYYFPPAPEVGGLRWQQMAVRLAEHGWAIDVVAGDLEKVTHPDVSRLAALPPGTRVFSVPTRESAPERIPLAALLAFRRLVHTKKSVPIRNATGSSAPERKRSAAVRAYLAWLFLVHDRAWAMRAARLASSLASRVQYDVIISSGPPHFAHEAARRVAKKAKLPLVVDLRDLWSLVERIPERIDSVVWWRTARQLERRVIRDASLVVVNTEVGQAVMAAAYAKYAAKIHVVRNGSDNEPLPNSAVAERFTIRFAGSIYIDRDPRLLFRAAAKLIAERALTPHQFGLEFVGHVDRFSDVPTMQIAEEEGIADFVRVGGFLTRAETMAFLGGATMLLSLPQDSESAIPAKIYEYVRFPAWLLVLADANSATARVLQGTQADVLAPQDVKGIVDTLRRRFDQFTRGERPSPTDPDGRFARVVQTDKLASLIDTLTHRKAGLASKLR